MALPETTGQPQLQVIEAFVPSSDSLQFVVVDNDLPRIEYLQGEMTREQALGKLGMQTLGTYLSPYKLLLSFDSLSIYVTDSIDPATIKPAENVSWVGIPYDEKLAPFARWWHHGFNRDAITMRKQNATLSRD